MSDQPVSTAAPWRTDPGAIQTRLAAWARHRYGDDAVVSGVEAPDSGMTNDRWNPATPSKTSTIGPSSSPNRPSSALVAREFSKDTQLGSLELGIESNAMTFSPRRSKR